MANIKHLTLLHSNDLHGDFLAENLDAKLLGGVSLLSGYINKVRNEEPNTLYAIAGDMFRGSVIDSEYKGLSTIEIMNLIGPDVVTLGNHEIDYGLSHLLFLEKCARFPIINANLYITASKTRLFQPQKTFNIGGMRVMFIGIITEEIMSYSKQDGVLGSFVDLEEAADAVGKIINSYKTMDIDLTVLLTHIGYEQDKKLAAMLNPVWGVDMIIGGHSHTFMDKPEKVNGILIAQAGTGTDQIGRFDLDINTDTNSIEAYTWQCVPVDSSHCPEDKEIVEIIEKYSTVVDRKFGRLVTRFARKLTHPVRYMETDLGNLFADILAESLQVDIMLLGSGSIRADELGPIVTFGDLTKAYPYDDWIYSVYPTGAQLKRMVTYIMRDAAFTNDTEFYQFSRRLKSVYDYATKKLISLTFDGEDVSDEKLYCVGVQLFHFNNFTEFFGVPFEEVAANEKPKILATSCIDVLDEYLSVRERVDSHIEGRIIVNNLPGYPVGE